MRLFANENLFEPIVEHLRALGHDVLSIMDAGLSGISDDEVYRMACGEKRIIVTMDKDFTRIFRFPPQNCDGIVVVKIYKRTVDETLSIFRMLFNALEEQTISQNLIIISPEGVRIRRTKSLG